MTHRLELCNIDNKLPSSLIPFPVICLLLNLLQHTLTRRSILQSELGKNSTELIWLRFRNAVRWHTQPQQKLVISVNYSSMDLNNRVCS